MIKLIPDGYTESFNFGGLEAVYRPYSFGEYQTNVNSIVGLGPEEGTKIECGLLASRIQSWNIEDAEINGDSFSRLPIEHGRRLKLAIIGQPVQQEEDRKN